MSSSSSSIVIIFVVIFVMGKAYLEWTEPAVEEISTDVFSLPDEVMVPVPADGTSDAKVWARGLHLQRQINRCLRIPAPSLGAAVYRCREKLDADLQAQLFALAQQINDT